MVRAMSNKKKEEIMRRRHIIAAIIAIIIITLLHLWIVVWWFILGWLFIALLMWIIDWLTGADLYGNPHEDEESDVSKTLWDIFTLHEFMDHRK